MKILLKESLAYDSFSLPFSKGNDKNRSQISILFISTRKKENEKLSSIVKYILLFAKRWSPLFLMVSTPGVKKIKDHKNYMNPILGHISAPEWVPKTVACSRIKR